MLSQTEEKTPQWAKSDERASDSLGIEDELFQRDDQAKLLPMMDYYDAFNPTCNPISAATLANLLNSRKQHHVIIVDCRFDYEYQAGHIKGAVNIGDAWALERFFLHNLDKLRELMLKRTIIVFHCEYSEKRGPGLWRDLRNLDRRINATKCSDANGQ